jgi:hypothetical protein
MILDISHRALVFLSLLKEGGRGSSDLWLCP